MTAQRLIAILLVSVAFLLPREVVCHAQASEQMLSQRAKLQKEIALLDEQLKANAGKSASALTRLSLVQNKIAVRNKLIRESDSQIAYIDRQMESKQREINALNARLDTMTSHYSRLVRSAYKNRDPRVWYMYILASKDLAQGTRRYAYLRDLSRSMNMQAKRIQEVRTKLAGEKDALKVLRTDAQKLKQERLSDMGQLRSEEASAKSITSSLEREKQRYQKELSAKKAQAEALEREIKKAISSSKKSSAPIDYTLVSEFVANCGKLPWPVEGPVVSSFGKQYHQVFTRLQLPQNNGVSIATARDAKVSSIFDGTVVKIAIFPGYHQCVLVQHGSYYGLYSKIKTVNVKTGDKVRTGQQLGTVDTIDGETVFHFELWDEKAVPQNPEIWLRPR